MLMITRMAESGRKASFDLHSLTLPPSNIPAHTLSGAELFRELSALGVPGLDAHDGQQELLWKYAEYVQANTPDPWTGKKEKK